jgi:hypothetical protein
MDGQPTPATIRFLRPSVAMGCAPLKEYGAGAAIPTHNPAAKEYKEFRGP